MNSSQFYIQFSFTKLFFFPTAGILPLLQPMLLAVLLRVQLIGDQHERTDVLISISYLGFELIPSSLGGRLPYHQTIGRLLKLCACHLVFLKNCQHLLSFSLLVYSVISQNFFFFSSRAWEKKQWFFKRCSSSLATSFKIKRAIAFIWLQVSWLWILRLLETILW